MAHFTTVARLFMAAAAVVARTLAARAIGALLAAGLLATSAAGDLTAIHETFDSGTITTHNGTSVVWSDNLYPWGPGTSALGVFPPLFPLGTKYWQSQPTPQNFFDSILFLTVEIGPQGGSLSFDWAMFLAESGLPPDIFLVKLDADFLLFEQGGIIDGHVDVNLLPGSHFIQFAVSPFVFNPAGGAGIDNVRVTGLAVPEPASWMLVAMGGLGLLYRRRSRTT